MKNETLTYLRPATRAKDGFDGLLYRNTWETGYQLLIFETHEAAARFIAYNNAETKKPETNFFRAN